MFPMYSPLFHLRTVSQMTANKSTTIPVVTSQQFRLMPLHSRDETRTLRAAMGTNLVVLTSTR